MKDWTTSTESFLRDVAGDDLAGVPVYLLSADEAESIDHRLRFKEYAGWTTSIADLLFSNWLHSAGRWTGRGFATAIDITARSTMQELYGTALHELAHWLDDQHRSPTPTGSETADATMLSLGVTALEVIPAKWSAPAPAPVIPQPRWHQHGRTFVRAASHLAYRASRQIESIRPRHIIFGSRYYADPFTESAWLGALSDELDRDDSILDILATDPPAAFSERWAAATATTLSEQKQ